jgi:hypothetical protein
MKHTVIELQNNDSGRIKEINKLIDLSFPEYSPTNVERRLLEYHGSGYPKVKIFFIEDEGNLVSFAQIIYKLLNNRLVLNLDLLGSEYSKRRKGYAETIFQYCRNDFIDEARRYGLSEIGLLTFIDPNYSPIVRFHEKNKGQIRRDIIADFDDILVWYPSNEEYFDIKTHDLLEQMKEFGSIIGTFK